MNLSLLVKSLRNPEANIGERECCGAPVFRPVDALNKTSLIESLERSRERRSAARFPSLINTHSPIYADVEQNLHCLLVATRECPHRLKQPAQNISLQFAQLGSTLPMISHKSVGSIAIGLP